MTYTPNVTQIQKVNSTTYADITGVDFGLPRLLGETAEQYLKRLEFAANLTRTAPYPGALNQINLALGLEPAPYIHLQFASIPQIVTSSIAGIVIGNHPSIPILTFDQDTMWDWQSLSEVVANINLISSVVATLLVPDGPAFQIARQTNSLWSFSEEITGIQYQLQHQGVVVGSELFDQTIPSYTLTEEGLLTFIQEPQIGTHITYNYIVGPYNMVGAPVALIGLTDPEFASVAETSNGVLAYQVSEFVQNIMETDLSYWGV